jgi:hypothetical protein
MMLTRRVRGRTLLLRPCPRTNQIVQYVVAVMAAKWNICVHAFVFLGNHYLCAAAHNQCYRPRSVMRSRASAWP